VQARLQRGKIPCVPSQPTPCRPSTWPGVRTTSGSPAQRRASAARKSGSTGRVRRSNSPTVLRRWPRVRPSRAVSVVRGTVTKPDGDGNNSATRRRGPASPSGDTSQREAIRVSGPCAMFPSEAMLPAQSMARPGLHRQGRPDRGAAGGEARRLPHRSSALTHPGGRYGGPGESSPPVTIGAAVRGGGDAGNSRPQHAGQPTNARGVLGRPLWRSAAIQVYGVTRCHAARSWSWSSPRCGRAALSPVRAATSSRAPPV